jgi:hypothetical protein
MRLSGVFHDKPNVHLLTRHHVTYALTVHDYITFIVLLFKLIVSIVHALAMSHPFIYLYHTSPAVQTLVIIALLCVTEVCLLIYSLFQILYLFNNT